MKNYAGLVLVGVLALVAVLVVAAKVKHSREVQLPTIEDSQEDLGQSPSDVGAVAPSISAETCQCNCEALTKQVRVLELTVAALNGSVPRINGELISLRASNEDLTKRLVNLEKCCEPKPIHAGTPSATRPSKAKILTMVYGETCPPCQQWKVSGDRTKIEAECQLVLININDAPVKPDSIPAFTLEIGGLKATHRGYLTYQRFKDMEKAIEDKQTTQ